ncbi:transposase [Bradyrhizobium brasilense]|uniref:transposase n=1 Tax=Bradyrhizobium brasilense TaxID=1419277 RepID=UPI0024C05FFA|nr:transposase [Bradyrhizobium brasilense]
MLTDCSAERFDFGVVEGRAEEAAFDAGLVTSDAGALLLGATDRAIDLVGRFADCFRDHRRPDLIEHAVGMLIGQPVFGISLWLRRSQRSRRVAARPADGGAGGQA